MAISRDASLLTGGIQPPNNLTGNKVQIGIVGMLTPDGAIRKVLCDSDDRSECPAIKSRYLSRQTTYQTVSLPKKEVVTSTPSELSDCYETSSTGETASRKIDTGIAAIDASIFQKVNPVRSVEVVERRALQASVSKIIGKQFASLPVPQLDRFEKIHPDGDGTELLIAEGFADTKSRSSRFFGIWRSTHEGYRLMQSNMESGFEEPENYIGTMRLKNETSDYIVTSARDEEGYTFNIYAMRSESLLRIFHGGGGGC